MSSFNCRNSIFLLTTLINPKPIIVVPGSIPNMMRSFANFIVKFRFFVPMITIPHKAKQFLVFTIKLLIVIGAFYFIYDQIANNSKLEWSKFETLVLEKTSITTIIFILLFSVANRYFEILKWQNLVTFIKPISIGEASKQVLGALTAGIFTPNGLGEYAGKAMFFKKEQTKKVVFLNLICNGI